MMTTEQIAINVTIAGINTERNNIAMAQMNKEFYQDKLSQGLVLTDNESHEIQFWADAANSAESKLAWLEQRLANFNTNLSEI
jgi:hypothetical protein